MDVPLIDQGAQPVAAAEEAPVVREVPSRGERLKYDFDVWYGSSESAEIVILSDSRIGCIHCLYNST